MYNNLQLKLHFKFNSFTIVGTSSINYYKKLYFIKMIYNFN